MSYHQSRRDADPSSGTGALSRDATIATMMEKNLFNHHDDGAIPAPRTIITAQARTLIFLDFLQQQLSICSTVSSFAGPVAFSILQIKSLPVNQNGSTLLAWATALLLAGILASAFTQLAVYMVRDAINSSTIPPPIDSPAFIEFKQNQPRRPGVAARLLRTETGEQQQIIISRLKYALGLHTVVTAGIVFSGIVCLAFIMGDHFGRAAGWFLVGVSAVYGILGIAILPASMLV